MLNSTSTIAAIATSLQQQLLKPKGCSPFQLNTCKCKPMGQTQSLHQSIDHSFRQWINLKGTQGGCCYVTTYQHLVVAFSIHTVNSRFLVSKSSSDGANVTVFRHYIVIQSYFLKADIAFLHYSSLQGHIGCSSNATVNSTLPSSGVYCVTSASLSRCVS